MSNMKKRYSIPARVVELLFTDDSFFNEVLKIKKMSGNNKFPKSDEWRDDKGFNLSFALAGYSPDDVSIEVEENVLIIRGSGMDSITQTIPEINQNEDMLQEYTKEGRPRIHVGAISRGIARRSFCVKHLVSEEFDVMSAVATMEHGLLHVVIPEKGIMKQSKIEIKGGK